MRVGVIDCGTNSIRLLIADIDGGNFREVTRQMQVVRLGQGVDETNQFHPDAISRTFAAVDLYATEIVRRGVEKLRFCATSATRDALNRNVFVDGVKERLGIEPEVISGDEEARLSFAGATREFSRADGPFLVVDIGGGSTEFVFGTDSVDSAISVNIGCVRMTERHFHNDPPTADEVAIARSDIQNAIDIASASVDICSTT
jgi:exopolyphosphatase/guanosine-5'-triphosphate,3'-diphosphate pyrophosphatase